MIHAHALMIHYISHNESSVHGNESFKIGKWLILQYHLIFSCLVVYIHK